MKGGNLSNTKIVNPKYSKVLRIVLLLNNFSLKKCLSNLQIKEKGGGLKE